MHAGNVCVAASCQNRPIRLHNPQPDDRWIQSIGGLMPGQTASVAWRPSTRSIRPHLEDVDWTRSTFQKASNMAEDDLVASMKGTALTRVLDAFGEPLFFARNGNAAFKPGAGDRSLASVLARSVRAYRHFEGVRVDFVDGADSWTGVPLQDLMVRRHQTDLDRPVGEFRVLGGMNRGLVRRLARA